MADSSALNGEHEGETFADIVADNTTLNSADFFQCVFRNASFQYAQLTHCTFEQCVFDCCNLSLMQLHSTKIVGTKFMNSKLSGINWSSPSGVFSASFNGCVMDNCAFVSMNLSKYKFISCSFCDASFINTKLSHCVFEDCDLRNCAFHKTDLSYADLSSSCNYFMDAESNRFHKTKFSLPEAVSLLSNFDIILK
ncbi:MAG: pentapeptide repeat-containing protein [Humidesulfovibrio sp.]|nr:pentapeptide repeat-containing protein [Humidesulfovibrio sp.]